MSALVGVCKAMLHAQPATVDELCLLLWAAGLHGDRIVDGTTELHWPHVRLTIGPKGRQARFERHGHPMVIVWDEYPLVRRARARCALRYRWP